MNRDSGFVKTVSVLAVVAAAWSAGGLAQSRGGVTSFPIHQREPADPVVVERGRAAYDVECRSCHGADLRGGERGGPNLLRSEIMLNDRDGELLRPILQGSHQDRISAAGLTPEDVRAVASYVHSVQARSPGQGMPPPGPPVVLDVLVGDAAQGETYFRVKCAGCHSAEGDLKGIGARDLSAVQLQNLWLVGGRGRPAGPGRRPAPMTTRRETTAIVTLPKGQKYEGRLERIDEFVISLTERDGTFRSFKRSGAVPNVEIRDPLEAHRHLLREYADKDIHDVTAYLATLKHQQIPGTPNPEPGTQNPEPGTQNPEPGTRNLEPILDPASIARPLADSWPTFSGDYTGRRYSALAQINQLSVKNLTLGWVSRLATGPRGGVPPTIIGGVGDREFTGGTVKGAILSVDGILYVTAPDNVWAIDARDGREIWHYFWKTRGGTHIGNRGAGMWRNYLFFETPDDYLVSLDARTGEERWHVEIADFDRQYFSTVAPVVVGDHVIVGTGNDLDGPGFLQSYDPETGALQWKLYTVPMNPGDPGLETWPSLDAARHGGGHPWMPGAYDPETKLYIFGTGNPTPSYTGAGRAGDNLFTCSLIAVHVDTGKMAWYYQLSPHDTHDFDAVQQPVLIDKAINGIPRKLVSIAARNGHFFTLDRVTGEHIVTTRYGTHTNWAKGLDTKGAPIPNPEKEATIPGALVSPEEDGTTNWQPPAYSPATGLFYTQEDNGFNMLYLTDPDPRGSMGLGGKMRVRVGAGGKFLTAIEPASGKVVWRRPFPTLSPGGGGTGLLATAGGLLFGGDGAGNFVARSAKTGAPLWHARVGAITNAPQTYMLDGRQHVLIATGDMLWTFTLR